VDICLIPEVPFEIEKLLAYIEKVCFCFSIWHLVMEPAELHQQTSTEDPLTKAG